MKSLTYAQKQNWLYILFVLLTAVVTVGIYYQAQRQWILFGKAEELFIAKKFDQAIPLYLESQKIGKTTPVLLIHLGSAYEATNQFPQAIDLYKTYLQEHPTDTKVRHSYAQVLLWNGNYDESELEYKKILGTP